MDTSNGYNHHHNSPNQPGRDSSSTKSSSESHTISPFTPSAAGHLRTQALDPNVNFDWDQWDAVFGQYLPVVDGFMDVDNIANHNQNQMQCNEIALNQVPMMGIILLHKSAAASRTRRLHNHHNICLFYVLAITLLASSC
ncbi:hypothetical protein CISG_09281 [Coccidioides immitis RMSCC 3703]|uniref:Uncharacterized protein n=1 Tax=Coccidioides immitis RMSCC 3703 TaxID=454286 RepID=A0A0J8RAC9_COCIT|nr:hypothetical protein CISG_09281 [Coccidioides immitis RMSCC 3703]